MKKELKGDLLILFACFLWGLSPTVSVLATKSMSPLLFSGVRFLIGGLILSFVFVDRLRLINKKIVYSGIKASIFLSTAFVFEVISLQSTSPVKVGLFVSLDTVLIPLICFFMFKQKIRIDVLISLIFSVIGITLINYKGLSLEFGIGDMLAISAALFYSFQVILISKESNDNDVALLTIVQLLSSSVLCFALSFMLYPTKVASISTTSIIAIVISGIFCSGLAYYSQALSLKYISPVRAGIMYATAPIFNIILTRLILGVKLSNFELIGAIVIIVAIVNVELKITQRFKTKILKLE